MKVQEVKKECLATTGISIELVNSEMSAISRLVWNLEANVEKGIANATVVAKASEKPFKDAKEVNIMVDLESIQKVLYLLNQMCRKESNDLFWMAEDTAVGFVRDINDNAGLHTPDEQKPEVPMP